MTKELSPEKLAKYDDILSKSSIAKEAKNLTKDELVELKSYAIKKALKLKKYVRD
jgi:hypothetical protein